jgi:toxin YoeB
MSYLLKFTSDAVADIDYFKKSGNLFLLKKLDVLLEELTEHPHTGTGHPEELKHKFSGCLSRRITDKHRLVYRIKEELGSIEILFAYGHYRDK